LESRLLLSANVLSYHNDAASTGQNLSEAVLTPANVNIADFGKFYSTPVDGQVYAQPLYVSGVNVTSGPQPGMHNVVYVATEHDSLYAIDSDSGNVLWKDSFLIAESALISGGNSVVVSTASSADVNSDDITPEIGITSTPAIDPNSGFLYLTAKTKQIVNGDTTNPHFVYTLFKVNIQSGTFSSTVIGDTSYNILAKTFTYNSGPYVPDPAGNADGMITVNGQNRVYFNALRGLNRVAVTLYNGNAYLGFASHGDNDPYHGWILGYSESSLAPTAVFNADPDGSETGIWQSGGKIAIDPQGFLYVMTGNGTFDTTLDSNGFPINGDYRDSVLKFAVYPSSTANNPNINGWGLKVVDYFTPMDQSALSSADQDLGSGGPLVLPQSAGSITIGSAAHPNLLIGSGKEGKLYVIDRDNMGHYSPNTDNVVQEIEAFPNGGAFDTASFYFDGSSARIYYVGLNDNAHSFTISNATLVAAAATPDVYGTRGATASISANSTANGIVWAMDIGSNQLRAYSAVNFSQELWTSAQAAGNRDALGTAVKFAVPTVADGQVFVGTTNALVTYGELSAPISAPTAPSNLTAAAVSAVQVNLSWQDNSDNEGGFSIEQSTDGGNTWTVPATASANATSYALSGLQPNTTYTFRVRAFNSKGNSGYSNSASASTLSPPPAVDFSSGFSAAGSSMKFNGAAAVSGSDLQLTNANGNEAASTFSTSQFNIQRFTTSFLFQQTSAATGGITFTLQRGGPGALGSAGTGLGYAGIGQSLAVKFDFEVDPNSLDIVSSTGVFTNGASPAPLANSIDLAAVGIALDTGDVMQATLQYDGTNLHVTLTDTVSHATFDQSFPINIPSTIGGNTAYVGFTAGTPNNSPDIQNILSWSYTPLSTSLTKPPAPTNLSVAPASGTQLNLSWSESGSATVDFFNVLKLTSSNTYTTIAQVPSNQTIYVDGGLTPGSTYSYEVIASNPAGDSAPVGPISGTTPVAPLAPINLQATNVTATTATLTWQNRATNATGIKIVRQLNSNNSQLITVLPASATSYNDSGLVPGSNYQYVVAAYNLAGPSPGAVITFPTVPSAPSGLSATGGINQIHLIWSAQKGADSYRIYRGTAAGAEASAPFAIGVAVTNFVDPSTSAGTTYYYKITAVNASGESSRSVEAFATAQSGTVTGVPSAPTNLKISNATAQTLTIGWNAVSGATGYQITRQIGSDNTISVHTLGGAATSFDDSDLTPSSTYHYVVFALNDAGVGPGAAISAQTGQLPAPAAPTDVTATANSQQIALSWSASTNASSYNIYRGTAPGAESTTPLANVTNTSYIDTTAQAGTTYYYTITAVNSTGASNLSTEVSAEIQLAQQPPPLSPSVISPTASGKLPKSLVLGRKLNAGLKIVLNNTAAASFNGSVTITFYLSNGQSINGSSILLPISVHRKLKLKSNHKLTFHIQLHGKTSSLAPGSYTLLLQLKDGTGATNIAVVGNLTIGAPPTKHG
jgi:fibronectin type 3 domain-containing protein